ncbi:MAG: DUF202 domain-containing protein [Thermoleophilaceae bacterium]|nr:DUF202 domain-containing protein [Thermoleophilaceae bacterium]
MAKQFTASFGGGGNGPADDDVTRRTRLAAERTWLAWWRSGIAAATAAVGVGGVLPSLVDGARRTRCWEPATPCWQQSSS